MTATTTPTISTAPPSPELEVFLKDVGTWDATVEVRPAPGAPAQHSRGVARNRLACGGRWLITEYVNHTSGFEGHGTYGYDVAKQRYVGAWVDAMRTFLVIAEGTYDPATKTMTFWTEAPGRDGAPTRWRETTETVSRDRQVFRTFLQLPDGGEFEMMTVTYDRRPDAG